jgi:hypothetical protein
MAVTKLSYRTSGLQRPTHNARPQNEAFGSVTLASGLRCHMQNQLSPSPYPEPVPLRLSMDPGPKSLLCDFLLSCLKTQPWELLSQEENSERFLSEYFPYLCKIRISHGTNE